MNTKGTGRDMFEQFEALDWTRFCRCCGSVSDIRDVNGNVLCRHCFHKGNDAKGESLNSHDSE